MALPALSIKSLTKKFGGLTAVRDLSLEIAPGEIFGLIGPNGSGKTTTVKLVAGLYRPSRGAVTIGGADLAKAPSRAKAMLGYVPDDPGAYDRLTGREFLEFVGELYGLNRADRRPKIDALLARFGLGALADGQLGQYSRGTKQKISLLAALLHEPSLLIIDEPMVGLDPLSIRVTRQLLKDFAKRGGAVLLVTHTLPVAEDLCDRVGLLKEGRLAAQGTVRELLAQAGLTRGGLEAAYLKLSA